LLWETLNTEEAAYVLHIVKTAYGREWSIMKVDGLNKYEHEGGIIV
jgi:hypothetical protein